MIRNFRKGVKVDKAVKPRHFSMRKEPQLVIGASYYVSFGNNMTYSCNLSNLLENQQVEIEIYLKPVKKRGYLDFNQTEKITLFSNEIGLTREEAVLNTVSS